MKTALSVVFESSKSGRPSPADESRSLKTVVKHRTVQRTNIAVEKSKAIIEDTPMPELGWNNESEADITTVDDDDEASGNVSTVVLPSTSTDFKKSTHDTSDLAMSPFYYRLRSDSPLSPNRSFISGAFTSPGASSISTTTTISHESLGDCDCTHFAVADEGFDDTSSIAVSMELESYFDGVDVGTRDRGVVEAEFGKVGREIGEEAANARTKEMEKEKGVQVAFKSLPLTCNNPTPKIPTAHRHSRTLGNLVRKIVPTKRSSTKCPAPAPDPHLSLPLAPKSEVSLPSPTSSRHSPGWTLPDDLRIGPGPDTVGPWKLYVPGIGLISVNNASVAGRDGTGKSFPELKV